MHDLIARMHSSESCRNSMSVLWVILCYTRFSHGEQQLLGEFEPLKTEYLLTHYGSIQFFSPGLLAQFGMNDVYILSRQKVWLCSTNMTLSCLEAYVIILSCV